MQRGIFAFFAGDELVAVLALGTVGLVFIQGLLACFLLRQLIASKEEKNRWLIGGLLSIFMLSSLGGVSACVYETVVRYNYVTQKEDQTRRITSLTNSIYNLQTQHTTDVAQHNKDVAQHDKDVAQHDKDVAQRNSDVDVLNKHLDEHLVEMLKTVGTLLLRFPPSQNASVIP